MKYFKIFLIILSVIMSLGGAVNSGWSKFTWAIPFMICLVYLAYKQSKSLLLVSIVFVVLCITISKTQDRNPFLYPIISGGEVTIMQDGFQKTYHDDGSGGFTSYERITLNQPTKDEKKQLEDFKSDHTIRSLTMRDRAMETSIPGAGMMIITKVSKGDVYKVSGVSHSYGDFSEHLNVRTSVGQFTYNDIRDSLVTINKPLQSEWAKYLGNLMYWPVFPILGFSLLANHR